MTLQECYQRMEGDYAGVLGRLAKEERIKKFVLRFLDDPTFRALCEAKGREDYEAVFREIHTLKGVSQNLGFAKLYQASFAMTEAVRGGIKLEDESLFDAVQLEYGRTLAAIEEYKNSL